LEGLGVEDFGLLNGHFVYLRPFGTFCGHLVYFMFIWYILCLFGIVYGYLVYFMFYLVYLICSYLVIFSHFGMLLAKVLNGPRSLDGVHPDALGLVSGEDGAAGDPDVGPVHAPEGWFLN
jgi:hypothetical protein